MSLVEIGMEQMLDLNSPQPNYYNQPGYIV